MTFENKGDVLCNLTPRQSPHRRRARPVQPMLDAGAVPAARDEEQSSLGWPAGLGEHATRACLAGTRQIFPLIAGKS